MKTAQIDEITLSTPAFLDEKYAQILNDERYFNPKAISTEMKREVFSQAVPPFTPNFSAPKKLVIDKDNFATKENLKEISSRFNISKNLDELFKELNQAGDEFSKRFEKDYQEATEPFETLHASLSELRTINNNAFPEEE